MTYRVRWSRVAKDDIERLHDFILQRDENDFALAESGIAAILHAVKLLETSPFSCRKTAGGDAFLRELIIAFGMTGYVALFEIEDARTVTVLAVRHQREDDYH